MKDILIRCSLVCVGIVAFMITIVAIGYVTCWAVSLITGEAFWSGVVGLVTALLCAAFLAGVVCLED